MDTTLAKASHWSQILSCLLTAIMLGFVVWPFLRPQEGGVPRSQEVSIVPYWLIAVVAGCIVVAAALHVGATVMARKPMQSKPETEPQAVHAECQKTIDSLETDKRTLFMQIDELKEEVRGKGTWIRHWKGEAEREQLLRKEQVEIRDKQIGEQGGKIGNLEQQLRVSQNTVDSLRDQLCAPNGRFKLKRVRYIATESRSLELRDVGKLPEKDLTEFFEDKYLENGKLVIPPGLYRKLFGPLNDPSLGVPKVLEIRFVHAGNEMSVLLPENISMTLPFPYAVTLEDMT